MSSAYTDAALREWHQPDQRITVHPQHMVPRLKQSDLLPYSAQNPDQSWNPPGHGDVYTVLNESGQFDRWLAEGIDYVFISNIDNILAQPCLKILAHMIQSQCPFLMEVASRGALDKKGGALVYKADQLHLLERAQVPEEVLSDFEDIKRFPFFNTNNIWIHIPSVKKWLHSKSSFLTPIYNPKTIEGTPIFQFETAMGSLVEHLEHAQCLHVDRDRFFPVKTTQDLLACRALASDVGLSDLGAYAGRLPRIQLSEDYRFVKDFSDRFLVPPRIRDCQSFRVDGPLVCNENVTLKGDVWIESYYADFQLKDVDLHNCHMVIDQFGTITQSEYIISK